jgi:hypothetical protein
MSPNADARPAGGDRPLTALPGIDPTAVAALKLHWIETAEQVLATAATAEGRAGLKALLSFDDASLEALLATLTAAVGPEVAKRLQQAVPGGARGLVLSEEQRKRFRPE